MENQYEALLMSVYSDKKLSKSQIRTININVVIDTLDLNKLNLKRLSIILVALTKIFQKRMKNLLEDSSHMYQLLSHATKKVHRAPSSKNITLEIQNDKLFINDEEINFGEETIVQELENSIIEHSFDNPGFDIDFNDAPSIEQVRDSVILSSGEVGNNTGTVLFSDLNVNVKRRRIFEDVNIEIAENVFRANLRTVQDLLVKPKANDINLNECLVQIDQKIESFLNTLKGMNLPPVEQQRQQEFDGDFSVPEISLNPIEDPSLEQSKVESFASLFSVFEDIANLSKQFIFNLLIQQLSKEEKAVNFMKLLDLANQGVLVPVQSEYFGAIDCYLVE